MRFDPVTYNVTEGDGNVAVGIRVVTSQPVPQATTIRIFDIPAVGQTSQATRERMSQWMNINIDSIDNR